MNKRKLYWTLQIGGWTFFVAIQVIFRIFASGSGNPQILFFTLEGLLFFLATHYFRYLSKQLEWVRMPLFRLVPRILVSALVMGFILYFFRLLLSVFLGLYQSQVAWEPGNIIGLSIVYSLIIFIWEVLYFAYHYFMQYNLTIKQDAAIMEIELNNLKSQLNPHFIFNSLNSIRALVDENPTNCKKAITQLSNILRSSLVSDKKRLTTFTEEFNIVKDYLGLEKIRYEERLRIHLDIHPDSGGFLVPPLMLQTLVENAIKHGISQLKKGGELSLTTEVTEDYLRIMIRNSGRLSEKGIDAGGSNGTGLGLANTMRRLEMLFGKRANFYIKNEGEGTVLTYLELPKTEEL